MKKNMSFIITLLMFTFIEPSLVYANETVDVYINGRKLETDQPAIVYQDRTMVPLRAICEKLGCTVEWDDLTQTAIIQNEITMLATQINNYYISKKDRRIENGVQKTLPIDVAPIIHNNRTLVPVRAISEALNADVNWNSQSNSVNITMEYDWISDYANGFACVSKNGKIGYIDKQGKIVIPIEYSNPYSSLSATDTGLIVLSDGNKSGILNSKNEIIIPFEYDYICDPRWGFNPRPENSNYAFLLKKGNLWGLANKYGEIVSYPQYSEMGKFSKNGLAMVRKDLNRGFIDTEGNEVVPLMYFWASDFNEGLALVEDLSGAFGYINNKGKTVIPFIYDSGSDFSEGLASVEVNGKWGIIDKNGKYIMQPRVKCDIVHSFKHGIAITENCIDVEEITYGFISDDGYVSKNIYTDLHVDDTGYIIAEKNGQYGYIDSYENIILPFEYDAIDIASNGLIPVMKKEKYGVVNIDGEVVIPIQYGSWVSFDSDEYGKNCSLTSINGKVGIIDINNNIVVPFKFDYAKDTIMGTVLVDESNKSYYDLKGNLIDK